ncbi:hypothetical protein [Oceanobacillus jeddahense]|uniref:hypothetical protein n=1 Tax=Oceanobacillus jeddahense TaxID=1462527 RepID=UPI0005963BF8|nr:hypothetical protein [Oceanobacillus jeddahense]
MERNVSVVETAEILGKSPQFVRIGLQRGLLPFGIAIQMSGGKYTYHISRKQLEEYIGKVETA